jgi:hypothetical protein
MIHVLMKRYILAEILNFNNSMKNIALRLLLVCASPIAGGNLKEAHWKSTTSSMLHDGNVQETRASYGRDDRMML